MKFYVIMYNKINWSICDTFSNHKSSMIQLQKVKYANEFELSIKMFNSLIKTFSCIDAHLITISNVLNKLSG